MNIPNQAFILAAGMGSRLRPYTDNLPKPMVEISNKPLLGYIFDHLKQAGINDIIVNTHYKPAAIQEYCADLTDIQITISHEEELLDTGGALARNIAHFNDSFFVINGDAFWEASPEGKGVLPEMAAAWDDEKMDILMLLQPVSSMELTQGIGDYNILPDGRAIRSLNKKGQYMFTSVRINHPRIFENAPVAAFSYLELMDKAQSQGRLYALIHKGDWHHISTPQDLETVQEAIKQQEESQNG